MEVVLRINNILNDTVLLLLKFCLLAVVFLCKNIRSWKKMYSQPVLLIRIRISYGRLDPDPALDFRIQLLKKCTSKDAIYCDQWSFQRKMIRLGSFLH